MPPMNQTVISGSSVSFTCGVHTFLEHNISWKFNNSEGTVIDIVYPGKYFFKDNYTMTTSFRELTVVNVDYEDRGVYTCNATNSIGSVVASANLRVHGE